MDVRRLEAFCKVYELKSFSKAALELFLSQPTISAHVLALESELGTQLFDRLGRVILPTAAGEILYKYSIQAFSCLENAKAEIDLLSRRVAGVLRIGGSSIPANHLLPVILSEFMEAYPDVKVELVVGDSKEVTELILCGDLSIGLVGAVSDHPDLVFSPLLKDELVLVCSPEFLSTKNKPSLAGEIGGKEICNWPFIMREHGSGTRKAFEASLMGIGLDLRCLNVKVQVQTTDAALRCASAGLGVTVTSRLAAQAYIDRGEILEVKVPSLEMSRSFYSVYHDKRHLFPAMRFFLDFLEARGISKK